MRTRAAVAFKPGQPLEIADASALGKTPGKDERSGKATYPALLGLDASRREAARLADEAVAQIPAGVRVRERLLDITRSVVDRSR